MILQAILAPHPQPSPSGGGTSLLECACLALLLSLLRYLLVEACDPPAPWLLDSVNAVLKVSKRSTYGYDVLLRMVWLLSGSALYNLSTL